MNTVIMPTWQELCDDPHLRDLPFKIEQDRYGRIVMSPIKRDHGRYQAEIIATLHALLPDWEIYGECGVDTSEGTKVPDAAAMTADRSRRHGGVASLPEAPEICVEILSWSNTLPEMDLKRRLYGDRGCREFWTCSEQGAMTFVDALTGATLPKSVICPEFPAMIRID